MSTIAMIPARTGSTRLKLKNLALVNGIPMIGRVIESAKAAGCFDRIVVNSDGAAFAEIAERHGVEFYLRPETLGSSTTKSDDVVRDFMETHPADVTAWVNSISPLQPADEIKAVMDYFQTERLDSLITVYDEQVHCLHDGQPVNFSFEGKFAQTQDLKPVRRFVYSIMAWRNEPFLAAMGSQGHAFFTGKVGYYSVSQLSALIVKTERDLRLCDALARLLDAGLPALNYDPLVNRLGAS